MWDFRPQGRQVSMRGHRAVKLCDGLCAYAPELIKRPPTAGGQMSPRAASYTHPLFCREVRMKQKCFDPVRYLLAQHSDLNFTLR